MKQWISFFAIASISIFMMNACGPSEEELERRRQARLDSIRQAQRQDSIEQARRDSIARAQARADSIAAAERRNRITYDPDGNIAVQVEAWRGVCKAEDRISTWQERGYENAYVVRHGKPETGNIWYRIRLGRFSNPEMANKLAEKVTSNFETDIWVASVVPGDEQVDTSKCEQE